MLELVAFGGTDVGKKRKNNEDSYAVDADRGVYIVA
ncbi:MAG: serine/threonine-protein phosphatase, partial [Myxococcales bacterium]|nr:serine/threonine-protein phosphatase [Myxococcales bacterium]